MLRTTVALDGREFLPGMPTGIGRYLSALIDHVRRQPPQWNLVVVSPPGFTPPPGVPAYSLGTRDTWAWDSFYLPRHLARTVAAAFITPYLKFRPARTYAVLAVVCDTTDVQPMVSTRGALARPLLRAWRHAVAQRASLLVTISAWSRDELARILRLPRERFRIIYPGVAPPPSPPAPAATTGYILHLGNGKPHKNVGRLVEAYAGLPAPLQACHALVLAGTHAAQRPFIDRIVALKGLGDRIQAHGLIPEEALSGLYAGAALFAFPSLAEGFGIPPLEAMAHGIPVVASTAGALPEVLGDAALLADPLNVRALREAIGAALTDRSLRDTLTSRGLVRARAFPVERTGAALAEAVQEVLSMRVAA
jgi:glycosyltransferase involved in cell wall biosynthesis